MAMSVNLERVVGRALIDPQFRSALAANPEQAITSSGIQLSAADLARLRTMKNDNGPERVEKALNNQLQAFWG